MTPEGVGLYANWLPGPWLDLTEYGDVAEEASEFIAVCEICGRVTRLGFDEDDEEAAKADGSGRVMRRERIGRTMSARSIRTRSRSTCFLESAGARRRDSVIGPTWCAQSPTFCSTATRCHRFRS